jgi:REP element-mobilizing transposase RayT
MSRKPRLHETGDIHHIMSHGIDSLNLFENDQDRQVFMNILDKNFLQFDCHCYGFVFMDNHYHLLIRPAGDTLSKMMRIINNTYARYLNKSRGRRGYVFRDRFKSIPTRDLNYVRNLILYIHANPVRGNILKSTKELDSFRWSSHRLLKRKKDLFSWFKRDYTLSLFTSQKRTCLNGYISELRSHTNETTEDFNAWDVDPDHKTPEPIIPSTVFKKEAQWVRKIVKEAEKKLQIRKKLICQPDIIKKLLSASCKQFSINKNDFEENIRHRTNEICRVVKLFSYWAIEIAGFSGVLVGKILHRSNSSVLRMASLGRPIAQNIPFPVKV